MNTSILEDALDNNVMIKNQDNTLSPLTIFPEIFVYPKSQDWDYYLPSNDIPKDELPTLTDDAVISLDHTYKTVVNDIFKDTPFVGHYITINNVDAYPYTGYKTLYDEATRTSYNAGGSLAHKKSGDVQGESQDLNYSVLLPEITITPSQEDKEALQIVRDNIPIKKNRDLVLSFVDDYNTSYEYSPLLNPRP